MGIMSIAALLSIAGCRDLAAGMPASGGRADPTGPHPAAVARDVASAADVVRSAVVAFQRHPRLQEAVTFMDGEIVARGREQWWKVELKGGETAVFTAPGEDRDVDEIEISFRIADGLRLRDLVSSLGPYTKVFESKTAGVRFDRVPTPGITAIADLFSSKVLPDSEVVRVSIRRRGK